MVKDFRGLGLGVHGLGFRFLGGLPPCSGTRRPSAHRPTIKGPGFGLCGFRV